MSPDGINGFNGMMAGANGMNTNPQASAQQSSNNPATQSGTEMGSYDQQLVNYLNDLGQLGTQLTAQSISREPVKFVRPATSPVDSLVGAGDAFATELNRFTDNLIEETWGVKKSSDAPYVASDNETTSDSTTEEDKPRQTFNQTTPKVKKLSSVKLNDIHAVSNFDILFDFVGSHIKQAEYQKAKAKLEDELEKLEDYIQKYGDDDYAEHDPNLDKVKLNQQKVETLITLTEWLNKHQANINGGKAIDSKATLKALAKKDADNDDAMFNAADLDNYSKSDEPSTSVEDLDNAVGKSNVNLDNGVDHIDHYEYLLTNDTYDTDNDDQLDFTQGTDEELTQAKETLETKRDELKTYIQDNPGTVNGEKAVAELERVNALLGIIEFIETHHDEIAQNGIIDVDALKAVAKTEGNQQVLDLADVLAKEKKSISTSEISKSIQNALNFLAPEAAAGLTAGAATLVGVKGIGMFLGGVALGKAALIGALVGGTIAGGAWALDKASESDWEWLKATGEWYDNNLKTHVDDFGNWAKNTVSSWFN